MEAYPSTSTLSAIAPLETLTPASELIENHHKATGGAQRIAVYLANNFSYPTSPLDAFVYITQVMQADAMTSAYSGWRRKWCGPGREYCGGALVWQLNDCWPTVSWAIVDYFLNPKLAYHSIKRALAPLALGVERRLVETERTPGSRVDVDRKWVLDVWISSSLLVTPGDTIAVTITAFSISTGAILGTHTLPNITPPANASHELATSLSISALKPDNHRDVAIAISAPGVPLVVNWPEPIKFITWPTVEEVGVKVVLQKGEVEVLVERPVKAVVVERVDGEVLGGGADWKIGGDLVPGVKEVVAREVKGVERVRVRWVGNEVGVEVDVDERH